MSPDPAGRAGYLEHPPRLGFFTDTSVCIGCKACEVACKEWNAVPEDGLSLSGMSYDNTVGLGASTWRHVAFIEQPATAVFDGAEGVRWLMASDVCKHCTESACLDVCPTGALFRTEFGSVVVQQDICNGCGYCVSGCPYGVIDRRPGDGRAFKCTLCYDRLRGDLEPACAKACPTDSIIFGNIADLRQRAADRVEELRSRGLNAYHYGTEEMGADPSIGGLGASFILLDDSGKYNLPAKPTLPQTRTFPGILSMSIAALFLSAATAWCLKED